MQRRVRKFARTAACAALAGAMLVGPMGLKGADAAQLGPFSSVGTGYALRVTLDLSNLQTLPVVGPVLTQAWGALGKSGPIVIDQFLVKTTSDADKALTKAVSVLGEGFTDFGGLKAIASSVGQTDSKQMASQKLPADALPLVNLATGILKAAVGKGPAVSADGSLASVTASLNDLLGDLQLPVDLTNVLNQIQTTVNDTVGQLEDVLAGGLATAAVSDATAPVTEALTGIPTVGPVIGGILGDGGLTDATKVTQITDQLTDLLDLGNITDLLTGNLAQVRGLVNSAVAQKNVSGNKAVADATSKLAGIDVLGGLLSVGAMNISSHSEATGVAGGAKNSHTCSLLDVKVGGNDAVSLDGKTLFIGGQEIAVVGNLVGQVKGLVDQLLGTLGLGIGLCDAADATAAADGSKASQSVSALRVELAPKLPVALLGIPAGEPLFKLVIDPTVQTAVAAQPAVAAPPVAKPNLPKTGAPIAATVFTGLGLAGAALLIRRRFAAAS